MSDEHVYAYGVIEQEDNEVDVAVDGVGGATRAYTIDYRSLAAVVSDIDTMDPERSDENLRAHDDVLQTIMYHDGGRTVVPMGFGMTFTNTRTLKSVLRGGRRAFTKALRDVDGMVELGIKLVADEETTIDRERVRDDVVERLATTSVQEAENDLFSDRLIMNRSYLVDRSARADFDRAVDAIIDEYSDRLSVQYTGPWAPYNFVDIEIGTQ
jgi:hypothetical protein